MRQNVFGHSQEMNVINKELHNYTTRNQVINLLAARTIAACLVPITIYLYV